LKKNEGGTRGYAFDTTPESCHRGERRKRQKDSDELHLKRLQGGKEENNWTGQAGAA